MRQLIPSDLRASQDKTQLSWHTINQYASSSGNRAHSYAELAVSSPPVAKAIASTHSTDPRKDGQAEWAWINTGRGVHQSQY